MADKRIFVGSSSAAKTQAKLLTRLTNTFGVLRIDLEKDAGLSLSDTQLLEAFADQLATVVERERLMQSAAQALLSDEAERLRKTPTGRSRSSVLEPRTAS